MRHDLVEAQVEVLRMYLEKRSRECLLEALDRLVECTQASFAEEEELLARLGATPDPDHRDMHNVVLAELDLLRHYAMDFDRGRLLAQLIGVDRLLTSHLSDVVQAPVLQQQACLAERETIALAVAESQTRY